MTPRTCCHNSIGATAEPGDTSQRRRWKGDIAAQVREAAPAKVSGATIIRVETDTDHGSLCDAQVRKADGSEVEVLVNKHVQATAVNDFRPRR